jgi:hypothetical protein
MNTYEAEISQQVFEGELGRAVVEDLECDQS